MYLDKLVARLSGLLGHEYGGISTREIADGHAIFLEASDLFPERVLVAVKGESIAAIDALVRRQISQEIGIHLNARARTSRWVGEYEHPTSDLLGKEGIDFYEALTNPEYAKITVPEKLFGKVKEGEAVLQDLARLLLSKARITLSPGKAQESFEASYEVQGYQFYGKLTRDGLWPTAIYTAQTSYTAQVSPAKPLRKMPLQQLKELKDNISKLPNNGSLTISEDALMQYAERQGLEELSKALGIPAAFGLFEKYGLSLENDGKPCTQEQLFEYILNSIHVGSAINLEQRTAEITINLGHGMSVNHHYTLQTRHNLSVGQMLFLVHGAADELGVTIDPKELVLVPNSLSLDAHGTAIALLNRDRRVRHYNPNLTNAAIKLLMDKIYEEGFKLANISTHRATLIPILRSLNSSDINRQNLGQLIPPLDEYAIAIENLPAAQKSLYQMPSFIGMPSGKDGKSSPLGFIDLVRQFSESLKLLQSQNNLAGVLYSAISYLAFQTGGRGITIHPELFNGRIEIFLGYKPNI